MKKYLLPILMTAALASSGQTVSFDALSRTTGASASLEQLTGTTPESYALLKNSAKHNASAPKRVKRAVSEGKAEIILEAHKVFGEFSKSGFQMLLDADATAYGDLFYDFSMGYSGDYADFEYKIPENADPSEETENVVLDGEIAIEIPAGKYDYMILYPFPGEGMVMPQGEFAKYDDFEFKDGYTYRFVCEYQQNESGYNEVYAVLYADTDAAVSSVILPPNGMEMSNQEEISINISNRGNSDISGFKVCYQIDNNETVTETYSGTIAPGETATYTFATKADFSEEKLYSVEAWIELEGDMIASNDSASGACLHVGAKTLPYFYDFSSTGKAQFSYDWTIIDGNADNNTWMYNEWAEGADGVEGAASCPGCWSGDMTGNDYLISTPLNLKAGNNHIVFYTKCVNPDYTTELLDVRFGTSTDVDQMTVIGDYAVDSSDWVKKIINFDVPEDGVYYVAFHAKSVDGRNVYIDDVLIGAGFHAVSPDLAIERVLLPYSNSNLSAESIVGAVIRNDGTGPTSTFTLTYTVNDREKVTQEFTDALYPQESKKYYFTTTADFSAVDIYQVIVEAIVDGSTQQATAYVENQEPVTQFPITTDFATKDGYSMYWNELNPGAWYYDEMSSGQFGTDVSGLENGLMSRGLYLDKPVRFKLQYAKGGWERAGMYVAFGKAGTDIATYTKVYEDHDINDAMTVEFTATPDEAGAYNFIIVNDSDEYSSLYLGIAEISKVEDYDLRITDIETPLARYIPIAQTRGECEFVVNVENRGAKEMTGAKVMLYNGADLIATSEAGSIQPAEIKPFSIKTTLPSVEVGGTYAISAKVECDIADSYIEDNTLSLPAANVTQTTFATENIEDLTYGTGSWGKPLGIGNVFRLSSADELASVTIGFANTEESEQASEIVAVAVYQLNQDYSINYQLARKELERGMGGIINVDFDPMKLNPGLYFFEVQQLSSNNMGLAYEQGVGLYCWQNIDGELTKTNGATLLIRAEFPEDAVVYETDGAVMEFTTPTKKNYLYSNQETVTVRVKNMGYTAATLPVKLTVNGVEAGIAEVTLRPYEVSDVEFAGIDLSTPGSYELQASVAISNDENPANDSLTETFIAEEELNPYRLDFESCHDFDAGGDTFNPRWTTAARVDFETDYFWAFEHTNRGKPVGFIAFNPEATKPAITEENLPGFFAHSGKKFGAAFCNGYEATLSGIEVADTWLISPKLKLNDNSSFELYVKTRFIESPDQTLEKFNILISETDNNYESFTVLGEEVREAPLDWTKVEVDLSAYDGKEVYVAVQYVGVAYKNVCLMVDDLEVKTDAISSIHSATSDRINAYYSPGNNQLKVSSEGNIEAIDVYNAQGARVYNESNTGVNARTISMSSYSAGVYIAKVTDENGNSRTIKFAIR